MGVQILIKWINNNLFNIFVVILIIFSIFSFQNIQNIEKNNVSASSVWEQTTESNFKMGNCENLKVLPEGKIKLAKRELVIEDNFFDNSLIETNNNISVNLTKGEAKLVLKYLTYGGPDLDQGQSMNATSDGGFIIVGSTRSYGAGNWSIWLLKLNKTLKEEWNRTFGDYKNHFGVEVKQTADNGYIILANGVNKTTNHDFIWLIKTDQFGKTEWKKTFKGDHAESFSLQQTLDNGLVIIGKKIISYNKSLDVWVIKTDSNGNEQWNKTYGGSEAEEGYHIQSLPANGYVFVGSTKSYGVEKSDMWLVKINGTGEMEWNKTYGGVNFDKGTSVIQTSDNGFLISGTTMNTSSQNTKMWLIKVNSTGYIIWNRTFDDESNYHGKYFLNQSKEDNYILVSSSVKSGLHKDIWVIKINDTGKIQFNKTYSRKQYDYGKSLIQLDDNNFLVMGYSGTINKPDDDIWLFKIDKYGNWNFTGNLTSKNLLPQINNTAINRFETQDWIPAGTKIEVRFSQDNKTWYNSSGEKNKWNTLNSGRSKIDLSYLNWKGPNFYYQANYSSMNQDIPYLRKINVTYEGFYTTGTFESVPFYAGNKIVLKTLNWLSEEPNGTNIKFQGRTGNTLTELNSKNFVGPDGKASTYYQIPGQDLWSGHGETLYIQYKAYFSTNDIGKTPVLDGVLIKYNYLPAQPYSLLPDNPAWTNNNTPVFTWNFYDQDSSAQGGFQWQMASDNSFSSIDYDSGVVASNDTTFQYHDPISDGTWYWRMKARDSEGDWGYYSDPGLIKIDTSISPPSITKISPSGWSNINRFNISWDNPSDLSGIMGVYYKLYETPTSNDDGFYIEKDNIDTISNIEVPYCGKNSIYIWLKDHAGNINFEERSTLTLYYDDIIKSPENLTVKPSTWTNENNFAVSWDNPLDHSGIIGAYYKLGTKPDSNTDGKFIEKNDIESISDISVPDNGKHELYVWLKDCTGNINYMNHSKIILSYDGSAPTKPFLVTTTPNNWTSINTFSINWVEPFEDSGVKNGIYYYIGDSKPTSNSEGTWADGRPINVSAPTDGEHTIYIWLEDIIGNVNFKNYATSKLKLDTKPPSIQHDHVNQVIEGTGIDITAKIEDEHSGIDTAILYYKKPSETNYLSLEMREKLDEERTYSQKIVGTLTDEGFEYYIKAMDRSDPPNIIYFGSTGETINEPTSETDLNIKFLKYPEIINKSPTGPDVNVSSNISISFNKPMDSLSIENSFKITPQVLGSFEWNLNTLIFTPNSDLEFNTKFTIEISTLAQDINGLNLQDKYRWSFSTVKQINNTDPVMPDPPENKTEDDNEEIDNNGLIIISSTIIIIVVFVFIFIFLLYKKKQDKDSK